ncbi:ML domain [Popillia japonica]|uniref:ML domain n=1 Tax=Popillia japonica TaxID=7064 RepID=A0AAW1KLV5_POPJA
MKQFVSSVVLIVAGLAFASSDAPVTDCKNGVSLPLQTQISGCEQAPCVVKKGSTVVLNLTFRAPYYIEELRPEAVAIISGISIIYPVAEPDGCKSLVNSTCPINADEIVHYQLQVPILSSYPTVSGRIKFTIYDEFNKGVTCFVVAARIVAAGS